MKIGCIIQARMTSQRLPGKILKVIDGKPMLQYTIERLALASSIDTLILATSTESTDDSLAEFADQIGIKYYRGPLEDVAARFLYIVEQEELDAFVRISGDSPLIDPGIVDRLVKDFRRQPCDMLTNILLRTYPKGMSVEVVGAEAFKKAYARMEAPGHFEHVTTYFYEHVEDFSLRNLAYEKNLGSLQLSVDTAEDFARAEKVLSELWSEKPDFTLEDVLKIVSI